MASAFLLALASGLPAQEPAPRSASVQPAPTPTTAKATAPRRTLAKPAARKTTPPRLAPKKVTGSRSARATAARGSGATARTVLAAAPSGLRDSIVALARAQVGTRYVFGGTNPDRGFDCSGLIRYLAQALKLDVPRTANEQSRVGAAVATELSRLRPGDLLTFGSGKRISHIGIYVGDGRFVHASTVAGRVIESRLDRKGRGVKPWLGVRRLFADADSASTAIGTDGEG
jgi:cell wall-associated NlpC family hydrolase